MHWMKDWASPFPIVVAHAKDATLTDIEGIVYDDFCLGDTPSMFGHAREELASALSAQLTEGVGYMLPSERSTRVAGLLAERFGLDYWQVATTASDANRAAIRWARAITGRSKIMVFDGCYHGMVDDCMVMRKDGQTTHKKGLIGQVYDMTAHTVAVDFNAIDQVQTALNGGEIAAILMEPVMTNCGMIAPEVGFLKALEAAAKAAGALIIYDETHTLSSAPEGYVKAHGLSPDFLVIGKAIAGGIPAAVWGVTKAVSGAMTQAQARIGEGSSGIGTTLSGNQLAMRAIETMLCDIITPDAFDVMFSGAARLKAGLESLIVARQMPWSVVNVGARLELIFAPKPAENAAQMRPHLHGELLELYHLYLINEGILIAPFHNMMLISPKTEAAQIDRLIAATDRFAQTVRPLL